LTLKKAFEVIAPPIHKTERREEKEKTRIKQGKDDIIS